MHFTCYVLCVGAFSSFIKAFGRIFAISAAIEKLDAPKREAVKRMKTATLYAKLGQAGFTDEELEPMTRDQLREAWAKLVAAGKESKGGPVATAAAAAAAGMSLELERERMQFEREKFQAEMEERRLAREMALASQAWERTRLEEEKEARRLAQEAEAKRAEEKR